ncbi:hypothetical protein ACFQRB_02570 [Halobaculum litoreum]|uniref:Uncharacterized protein n=1 Tax=Halobaculum litoreum TaxID=3031998 RepID=A0ABD5XUG4_9EURY
MRDGEHERVVGGGLDGRLERRRGRRRLRDEGHGLAFGVEAAAGERLHDTRGRLQRHGPR